MSVRIEGLWEQHGRLVEEGDLAADAALRAVDRAEKEAKHLEQVIAQAEAPLADRPTVSAVDAVLDWYRRLGDAIAGRIDGAATVEETNAALRTVLAHAGITYDGGTGLIYATFDLHPVDGLPERVGVMAGYGNADEMRFFGLDEDGQIGGGSVVRRWSRRACELG